MSNNVTSSDRDYFNIDPSTRDNTIEIDPIPTTSSAPSALTCNGVNISLNERIIDDTPSSFAPTSTTSFMANCNKNHNGIDDDCIPYIDDGNNIVNKNDDEIVLKRECYRQDEEEDDDRERAISYDIVDNNNDDESNEFIIINNDRTMLNEVKICNGNFPQWKITNVNNNDDINRDGGGGKNETVDEPEDVVCIVRCLYYSIQCCECTIV